MPAPIQEQIVAALAARLVALASGGGVPGLTVERERLEPITAVPFLAVYEMDAAPREDFSGEDGWSLTIAVEGLAGGATPVAARQAAAVLRAEAHRVVLADRTLGGLCRDITAAAEPPPSQLDHDVPAIVAGFAAGFVIEFATAEGDPYSLP